MASFPWQDFHNISHILFRFLDNTEKDCNLKLHCFFITILCFISFSVRPLIKINFLCSRVVFCPIKPVIYMKVDLLLWRCSFCVMQNYVFLITATLVLWWAVEMLHYFQQFLNFWYPYHYLTNHFHWFCAWKQF